MYRVAFYVTETGRSPVREFMDGMTPKERQRVLEIFGMLEEQGPNLRRPYADHVRGPLRELRVQLGRNRFRMFHFFVAGNLAVEERMLDLRYRMARGEVSL